MGYTIDESRTAVHFTPNAQVPQVFGGPRDIQSITIHHWGALGQHGPDILDWFCNPNTTAQTSAHFVVWDGNVYCIVSPPDAAWHAGNGEGNRTSIGIECHPEATDGDYATVAWLVSWLRGQYGDLPLHPHNFWTSTTCPGAWDLGRLDALARGTIQPASGGTVTPIPEDDMLTDAQAAQLAYIASPQFKIDMWTAASGPEADARAQFEAEITGKVWGYVNSSLGTDDAYQILRNGAAAPTVTLTDAQVQDLEDKLKAALGPDANIKALAAQLAK
jgi:hypothetical protein